MRRPTPQRPPPDPSYLALYESGELARRAARAVAGLARCRVCPRDCDVDRRIDHHAFCRTGRHAIVSSWFPHFGEEDCLRGWNGSGTIFFGQCNLRCVFCQNYEISQGLTRRDAVPTTPARLAAMMLDLQARGCHNINFVTPEHVVPQMLEALVPACEAGLRLPLIYNTSGYDSAGSLALLDGVIDVYMPDFKYWHPDRAARYLKARDYPDIARARIAEMHRQVGELWLDGDGLARRGLLVRHLVMPGGAEDTEAILRWLREALGPRVYVNLMDQYYPAGRVSSQRYPEINRRLDADELQRARRLAARLGLERLDERVPARRGPPRMARD